MRGIYSCGILDSFLQLNYRPFQLCVGVSAGANNLSGYISEMYQRNYKIYTDYSMRPEFISKSRFLRGGHLLDLDWLWEITIRELPINTRALVRHPSRYHIGLTDVKTGNIVYFQPEADDIAELLKASSAVPILYRNFVEIQGRQYIDGGIGDPIPVQHAIDEGATDIMVLRSRPAAYRMNTRKKHVMSRVWLRKYPELVQTIIKRSEKYNKTLQLIRNPPDGITIQEICPNDNFCIERLTKDPQQLEKHYFAGRQRGVEIVSQDVEAEYAT